jgi:hypothetical protein
MYYLFSVFTYWYSYSLVSSVDSRNSYIHTPAWVRSKLWSKQRGIDVLAM